jgi:hypothetical protein
MATATGDGPSVKPQPSIDILAKLDVEKQFFQRWIRCIAVVNFDLTVGQTCDLCVPQDALSKDETTNLVNLAFPDSNSGVFGDTSFSIRFRAQGKNRDYPFWFGFVFFRQKKDDTISRGYFQQSVVVVTHLPVNFEPLVNFIGIILFLFHFYFYFDLSSC